MATVFIESKVEDKETSVKLAVLHYSKWRLNALTFIEHRIEIMLKLDLIRVCPLSTLIKTKL